MPGSPWSRLPRGAGARAARVGRLWHAGELGIVEEHVVTYTTERLMALLAHRAARAPANGRTVICAAVAGNAHDIAVRVLADFFDISGWRAVHLGANVPARNWRRRCSTSTATCWCCRRR
jgi:methanogenic corrinoid protein MtbC1